MEIGNFANMVWGLGGRPLEMRERPFAKGFMVRVDFPDRNALALAIEASGQLGFVIEAGTSDRGPYQLVITIPLSVVMRFRALSDGVQPLQPLGRRQLPMPPKELPEG